MVDTAGNRTAGDISVEDFAAEALAWLEANATRKVAAKEGDLEPGDPFSVAVFHNLSHTEESGLLASMRAWNLKKASRGYHAITASPKYGGLGLTKEHARAFSRLQAEFDVPTRHELFSVTIGLIAPTILRFGTDEQKERWVAKFLATEDYACQLFSEPGAGSDLGALACRAERDGDEWVVNGQKVWSSGAQFAQWGELIARTDPDAVKHKGMTAFIVPLNHPGVEVRPIKQMSGGQSFNEVFFSDARFSDSMRLGDVGAGWNVALTTLGFERDHSDSGGGGGRPGGTWRHVMATARQLDRLGDPVMRQALMRMYTHMRVEGWIGRRAADLRASGQPAGPEGSLGKLFWTEGMTLMADVAAQLAGPSLIADTGQWGTYEWGEQVLGAPGYRIAGGSDEVQRNIIGERVLGLPGEPRVDKDLPWKAIPR